MKKGAPALAVLIGGLTLAAPYQKSAPPPPVDRQAVAMLLATDSVIAALTSISADYKYMQYDSGKVKRVENNTVIFARPNFGRVERHVMSYWGKSPVALGDTEIYDGTFKWMLQG